MKMPSFPLPQSTSLVRGLTAAFGSNMKVEIRDRLPNAYSSVCPSEIVTCKLDDNLERKIFVKYGIRNSHTGHGFWGDTGYESKVYAQVLRYLPVSAPDFYGSYADPASGNVWLFIEYAAGTRLDKHRSDAVVRAARWLGQFHAAAESVAHEGCHDVPKRYHAEYYSGWAERTAKFAAPVYRDFPWLEDVCVRFRELIPALTSPVATVIHGEFYPKNILVQADRVVPVDWQSAAVACGEIDLVALTEGWGTDSDTVRACLETYQQVRWPGGAPSTFTPAVEAARVYWPLRWLGDRPAWTVHERRRHYFDQLYHAAASVGLVAGDSALATE